MEWMSTAAAGTRTSPSACRAAEAARRLRTALDPDGDWIAARAARRRRGGWAACAPATTRTPAGWWSATDKEHAERLADRLARLTGERPDVVTSDEPDASARIAALRGRQRARGWSRVLMVSEGVDIPRLRVGVYATTARTELFFRQVVGRFIRRTPDAAGADEPRVPARRPDAEAARRGRSRRSGNHALEAKPEGEAVGARRARRARRRRSARCGPAPAATTT